MKVKVTHIPALVAVLVLAGCGEKTEPPEYADLSGTLTGTAEGTAPGVTFTGTSSLTVKQTDGTLEGTATLKGQLTIGGETLPFEPPGLTFTGTVAKGENPEVKISVPDRTCESTNEFSGSYASGTKELSLTGSIGMFADNCQKVGDLRTTLKLKK